MWLTGLQELPINGQKIKKNIEHLCLKFIVNNEDIGDQYNDIPIDKPLFPAVLLSAYQ